MINQTLTPQQIRDMALSLLDDAHGISSEAFNIINPLLEDSGNVDIVNAVEIVEGRAFVNENDAEFLRLASPIAIATTVPTETPAS